MKKNYKAFLILRVTKEYKAKLEKEARNAKMSLSEYIREQLARLEGLTK